MSATTQAYEDVPKFVLMFIVCNKTNNTQVQYSLYQIPKACTRLPFSQETTSQPIMGANIEDTAPVLAESGVDTMKEQTTTYKNG